MGIDELLKAQRQAILEIAAQHGASNVWVFGSVARGEARPDSDVDLLVSFAGRHSLLDRIAIKQDLEDLLGRPVDVVTEKSLRPAIRVRVLHEAKPL
jgi:hypothetical protein